MAATSLAERPQHVLSLVLGEASRRARLALGAGAPWSLAWRQAALADLARVSGAIRPGDPALADEIYAGRFHLAGRFAETGGRSPFAMPLPSRGFASALHGFEWLAHLHAAGDALASANARALVADWLGPATRLPAEAREVDVVARRALSWLAHSDFLLAGGTAAFRRAFLRGLGRELRALRRAAAQAPDGLPRLRARLALAMGAVCARAGSGAVRLAARDLGQELDGQVFADGIHASRNPQASLAVLADLLLLAQLFEAEQQPLPRGVVGAIDRMLPMLRFFRHADGALALFNGAGVADPRLVTALLRRDETLGEPITHARQGGYGRLSANGTVLLADIGALPPPTLGREAHAGTLAFEFSTGGHRFVVNCGAPADPDAPARRLARATAAHSTLTLADHSSARFEAGGALDRFLGSPLLAGPARIEAAVEEHARGPLVSASHDGYASRFGLVHERRLLLSRDGARIDGVDRLAGTPRNLARGETAAVRFHLHPAIEVAEEADGGLVLEAPNGECWQFSAAVRPNVEDGVFFGDPAGPRRSRQIVLGFSPETRAAVAWCFVRRRAAPRCPTADALARHRPAR